MHKLTSSQLSLPQAQLYHKGKYMYVTRMILPCSFTLRSFRCVVISVSRARRTSIADWKNYRHCGGSFDGGRWRSAAGLTRRTAWLHDSTTGPQRSKAGHHSIRWLGPLVWNWRWLRLREKMKTWSTGTLDGWCSALYGWTGCARRPHSDALAVRRNPSSLQSLLGHRWSSCTWGGTGRGIVASHTEARRWKCLG